MARRLHWTLAVLAGLLGALHVTLTGVIYGAMTVPALWFAGAGLAVIMASLVNVQALLTHGRPGRIILTLVNVVTAGFFAVAWTLMPEPQVAVGLGLFLGLTACSLSVRGKTHA